MLLAMILEMPTAFITGKYDINVIISRSSTHKLEETYPRDLQYQKYKRNTTTTDL